LAASRSGGVAIPQADSPRVDAVVPVYNAAPLVRRCIETALEHIGDRLGELVAVDDASDAETVAMLASLRHPKLRVLRNEQNIGYGGSVNRGIFSCRAPYVLQLNSDIAAHDDFLGPLVAALDADPALAALSPAGNTYDRYLLENYARRSGLVVSNHLSGYAFLIRRSVFEALNGFDPLYGRGYFEDTDLSRRILVAGHWLGVHPDVSLHHESHGTFSVREERRSWLDANRLKYHARWPDARRQVLLATRDPRGSALPPALVTEAWKVLDGGGAIWWVSPESPRELLGLGMRGDRSGLARGARRMLKERTDPWKRYRELWLTDDAPAAPVALLRAVARGTGATIRRWEH
jgi:GT2 family glycosyltransferase